MSTDTFRNTVDTLTAPADFCFAVVANDAIDLPRVTKAIYVGVGGNVTLRSRNGQEDVTFQNVPSGAILDVRVKAVRATGTTASGIVGLA